MKRPTPDCDGQTNLDFLFGVTIFILSFLFVFAFIPGMFTPFQSNSDEVTMIADRVAAVLVEDRLSLNDSGTKLPGIVDAALLDDLAAAMSVPADCEAYREGIGLEHGGNQLYDLEVIVEEQGAATPIQVSSSTAYGGSNIGQSKRFVMVRDPGGQGTDRYPGRRAILTVRVW